MPQGEVKIQGGVAAIVWLSFAGSLSRSSVGLVTLVVPIIYGCAKKINK